MNKLWLLSIVIFIAACNKPTTSYNEYNLKGRVWKIQETKYDGIVKNGNYELGDKSHSGYYQYVFNEVGNLNEYSDRYDDGDIYEITRYYYNDDDLCTKIVAYEDEDEDEDYIQWKQISVIKNGKIVGWEMFDEDDELVRKINLSYDGNLISEGDVEVIDEEYGYKYSFKNEYKKGQMVKQTVFNEDNEVSRILNFERNSNKDIIETHISYPDDSTTEVYKSIYEYDDNENWVKQVKFDEEGDLDEIIIREYQYYGKKEKIRKGNEISGIWFVIETDDDWFDEDDWIVIEAENKFDIGYDEEIWMSGVWDLDKKQKLFTLRSNEDNDSKKYKYDFIDNKLVLFTLQGEEIVKFEKR